MDERRGIERAKSIPQGFKRKLYVVALLTEELKELKGRDEEDEPR